MRKIVWTIVGVLSFAVFTPAFLAMAEENKSGMQQSQQTQAAPQVQAQQDVRHAYQPVPVNNNQWMQARVNNVAQDPNSKLVCVEAFHTNGQKTHLGCLTIEWGQVQNWSQEFNAPLQMLGSGTYTIQYTYRDSNGQWYNVNSMEGNAMTGSITR